MAPASAGLVGPLEVLVSKVTFSRSRLQPIELNPAAKVVKANALETEFWMKETSVMVTDGGELELPTVQRMAAPLALPNWAAVATLFWKITRVRSTLPELLPWMLKAGTPVGWLSRMVTSCSTRLRFVCAMTNSAASLPLLSPVAPVRARLWR